MLSLVPLHISELKNSFSKVILTVCVVGTKVFLTFEKLPVKSKPHAWVL